MKVSQAVDFHLQYHRANSKKNTIKTCEFVLSHFINQFGKRDLASISHEEILTFLLSLTKNNKQRPKETVTRFSQLSTISVSTLDYPPSLIHVKKYSSVPWPFNGKSLIRRRLM